MKRFEDKNILIAPYSPLTQKIATYLENNLNSEIIGFVDASRTGDNIYKKEDINKLIFDAILIFSPNHFKPIYKTLKQHIQVQNIYKIDLINEQYIAFNYFQIIYHNLENSSIYLYNALKKQFLQKLSFLIDKVNIKRDLSVFIAEDYIDANIKHMFLYHIKNNKKAILITNNCVQLQELKKYNLPISKLFSWRGYLYTALAKKIYLDHFILDYLEYTSSSQTTIQLWHGVGLKPIQDRSQFHYNYFISTSNWTNETNFQKVFKADKFLNIGYPRNDILLKEREETLDLIICDMYIYNSIQEDKKNNIKTILYMPTFRENGFDSFPLNFKTLNDSIKKLNIKFYVKLHPFVLNQYRDSIKEEEYSNVIFYNTQGDIYPILKYIDILVTDYSSIAYDFLLLDRPIIFFNYDYDEYIAIRGNKNNNQFLFNYYEYTPGDKATNELELIESIKLNLVHDDYKDERAKIKNIFYDSCDELSSERIYNYLKKESLVACKLT